VKYSMDSFTVRSDRCIWGRRTNVVGKSHVERQEHVLHRYNCNLQ